MQYLEAHVVRMSALLCELRNYNITTFSGLRRRLAGVGILKTRRSPATELARPRGNAWGAFAELPIPVAIDPAGR